MRGEPMQATIDLQNEDAHFLDQLGRQERLSSKELIERVVARYVAEHRTQIRATAFGIWKDHPVDGLAYQYNIRDEWPE